MLLIDPPADPGISLFHYCFGRVLAARWGYSWSIGSLPWMSRTQRWHDGKNVFSPVWVWDGQWPIDAYSGRAIAAGELRDQPGARVTLSGSFQRFELIKDFRETIRNDWLFRDDVPGQRPSGDFVICLHRGDVMGVVPSERKMPSEELIDESGLTDGEVRHLANTVSHDRLYMAVSNANDPQLERLRDLNAEVILFQGLRGFLEVRSFQKIAFGQSAVQWWAAFLSDSREIYFPPCDRGVWSHPQVAAQSSDPWHHGIDLRVDDDRYIYDWVP